VTTPVSAAFAASAAEFAQDHAHCGCRMAKTPDSDPYLIADPLHTFLFYTLVQRRNESLSRLRAVDFTPTEQEQPND